MPHALSVTDGTTTVSLSTANVMLVRYVPEAPQFDARAMAYKPVTESIEVMLYGASAAAVQTKLASIERVLRKAIERTTTGRGPRVFLQYQLSSDAGAWRSEVMDFRAALDETSAQGITQAKLAVTILITRLPFWEGPRTQLPLNNTNGSGSTAGLRVFNANDGSGALPNDRVNYADIAGADVLGSLPAPLELHLQNDSGAARFYTNFHIANNAFGTTPAHILEGENTLTGYGTAVNNAACSGGKYGTNSTASAGTLKFRFTVGAEILTAYAGRLCKVLGRFFNFNGRREARVQLYDSTGLTALGPPSPVVVTEYGDEDMIQDVGTVQLPPGDYQAGWGSVVLEIQLSTSGAETVDLDFIQLTPAEPLCYRRIRQRGHSIADGATVVDDGTEGKVYADVGGTILGGLWIQHTEPLHVFPGVTQRLTFLHSVSGASAGTDPAFKILIKAYYRPRRLTV